MGTRSNLKLKERNLKEKTWKKEEKKLAYLFHQQQPTTAPLHRSTYIYNFEAVPTPLLLASIAFEAFKT